MLLPLCSYHFISAAAPLGQEASRATTPRAFPPSQTLVRLSQASSKQATLDGKASCLEISDALWRHTATWVFARSPAGRLSLSLTATGSSNPGVRPADLRAHTFYVTLPPRTSLGPLNAKKQISTRASFDRQTVSLHENCVRVSLARLMLSPPVKYLARTCRDR